MSHMQELPEWLFDMSQHSIWKLLVVTYFLFNGKFICTLTMLFLRQHNVAILDCWKLQLTNHIVM